MRAVKGGLDGELVEVGGAILGRPAPVRAAKSGWMPACTRLAKRWAAEVREVKESERSQEEAVTMPRRFPREIESRRPDWVPGHAVTLVDGQVWWLPPVVAHAGPVIGPDGRWLEFPMYRIRGRAFDPAFDAAWRANRDAGSEASDRARHDPDYEAEAYQQERIQLHAEHDAMILRPNYAITHEEALQLGFLGVSRTRDRPLRTGHGPERLHVGLHQAGL